MSESIDKEAREIALRRAVEFMRNGAILLSDVCPICRYPLLKLRSGEVICTIHGRVMLVKTEEEVAEAGVLSMLTELEKRISKVLSLYIRKIDSENTSYEDARNIVYWLDAIERIERVKQMLRQPIQKKKEKREEQKENEENTR